jgi:hypothetical protein
MVCRSYAGIEVKDGSDIRPMHCLQLGVLQQLSRLCLESLNLLGAVGIVGESRVSETQAYKIPEQHWQYLLPPIFYRNRRPEGQVSLFTGH